MSQEIEMLKLLLEGQKEISETLKRVHERIDIFSEKVIVNEQSIKHLVESLNEEKKQSKEKFNVVHQSIRRRDGHLKWLAASIIMPIVLAIVAIFKPQ